MDALSLSHLTYCCATITVNFHRLDHPPFPCKSRLLPDRAAGKFALESRPSVHLNHHLPASHQPAPERSRIHEASHHHRNSSHRPWHHRIRHRRNLLHAPEKSRRPWLGPDLPQNPGHPSSLADFQHRFAHRRPRPGRRWSEIEMSDTSQKSYFR
jgi:hypothetical protein